jgi:hypothetical protein
VYQGGYDSRPAFIKRSQSNTETALPSPPTLASLRQEQIAAFMPSSYPSTEPVRPSEVSSPPPIYQNAIEEAPVPEYSPAEDNPSPTR